LTPIDAILAGDVGMNAIYLAFIFAIAVVITVVAFVFIYWSTKHPEEGDSHALAKYEKHWVVVIVVVFIAFSLSTSAYFPYPYLHTNVHPTMTVDVTAQQFAWTLCDSPNWANSSTSLNNPNCFPNKNAATMKITAGETVLFNVTSIDVTHDFGVYQCTDASCSTAQIKAQVQVMPGFYNSIFVTFSTPGTYYIRCLEFCGFGHYTMISSLNVTSS
jgi:cytochrome c oxidase subunit 2